jgi:hypothetical protein
MSSRETGAPPVSSVSVIGFAVLDSGGFPTLDFAALASSNGPSMLASRDTGNTCALVVLCVELALQRMSTVSPGE